MQYQQKSYRPLIYLAISIHVSFSVHLQSAKLLNMCFILIALKATVNLYFSSLSLWESCWITALFMPQIDVASCTSRKIIHSMG